MIDELYKKIKAGEAVRASLIALKKEIKDENNKRALFYALEEDYTTLYRLLEDEDAKVRKNTALIMGELALKPFKEKLFAAYQKEEKRFVKPDYLVALSAYDYSDLIDALKARLHFLTHEPIDASNEKHNAEETRILSHMCLQMERPEKHVFTGYKQATDMILLTNKEHKEVTLNQLQQVMAKEIGAGVAVRTNNLHDVLGIRTYTQVLFSIPDLVTVTMDPIQAAQALHASQLLDFMQQRHKGWPPFYFRIEMKSKMPLDKKSIFTKKLGAELERLSNRMFINTTSHYEFEIRLIENKQGFFNVLLKLYTLPDKRFAYRKNTLATSIAPDDAALIVALAKPYMQEDATVLDPFCGVGTMLIERAKKVKATAMYGVDIYGEAIDGAIENANWADVESYFINRDIFDFTHKYLFDEVITNMPSAVGRKSQQEIATLYAAFFAKLLTLVANEATVIMYTRDPELVEDEVAKEAAYTVIEKHTIAYKEHAYLYILKVNQGLV